MIQSQVHIDVVWKTYLALQQDQLTQCRKRKVCLAPLIRDNVSCYHYFACVGRRKPFTFTSSPLKPLSQNNRSCAFEYAGLRLKLDSTYSQNSLIKIVVQMELVGNLVPHKPANRLSITRLSHRAHCTLKFLTSSLHWFLLFFCQILELFQQYGICCFSIRFWNCSDSVVFFVFLFCSYSLIYFVIIQIGVNYGDLSVK